MNNLRGELRDHRLIDVAPHEMRVVARAHGSAAHRIRPCDGCFADNPPRPLTPS